MPRALAEGDADGPRGFETVLPGLVPDRFFLVARLSLTYECFHSYCILRPKIPSTDGIYWHLIRTQPFVIPTDL